MKKIFIDSSFFIAILHRGDQHHKEAAGIASKLENIQFVTTEMVLAEVLNSLANKGNYTRQIATSYVEEMFRDENTLIITQNEAQFMKGFELYKKLNDKTCGLTDCVSFNTMNEEKISEVLTFDKKDFSQFRLNVKPNSG